MLLGKNHRWRYRIFIFMCVLGIMSGCNLLSSPTSPDFNGPAGTAPCALYGHYIYTHYRSLEHDPATFPSGAEILAYIDYTQINSTSSGFIFYGGDSNAWEIEATCDGVDKATVDITLRNLCSGKVHTTTATSRVEISGNGTMIIQEYFIQWTCGAEESFMAKEWWVLQPVN